MAFLDNSGDIILDAVLTDTGRLRLAQGDGSFKIAKFALGDDEINYELYNKSHASGSAYYDLEVLQTPVLEAFTNNTSNLKSKLISLSRTNILYMPTLKLNRNDLGLNQNNIQFGNSKYFSRGGSLHTDATAKTEGDSLKFYVAVDSDTFFALNTRRDTSGTAAAAGEQPTITGLIQGYTATNAVHADHIRIDQGLDTTEIAPELGLDSDLLETAYIIETDYRLGRVKPPGGSNNPDTPAAVNFIDDDNIASYYITSNTYVDPQGSPGEQSHNNSKDKDILTNEGGNPMVFAGPRGSTLQFRIQASQELQSSTYLFTQIGTSVGAQDAGNFLGLPTGNDDFTSGKTIYYIDSTIRVVGANTGYRLDVPVRYIKIK